ncbi:DUF2334 domain-containing protein [Elusimicrobiota bacterium]
MKDKKYIRKPLTLYYLKKIVDKTYGKEIDLVSGFLRNKGEAGKEIKYIIRVDDYPHWKCPLSDFEEFHRLMRLYNVPYLLAVVPLPALDPFNFEDKERRDLTEAEKELLVKVSEGETEVGMHGISHSIYCERIKSELVGRPPEELKDEIENGLAVFRDIGISPQVFIAPFNTVSEDNIAVLSSYFKLITGGEETIKYLGYYWGILKLDSISYLPSYPPLYEKAKNILNYISDNQELLKSNPMEYMPITLHWSWEVEDRFKELKKLLTFIQGKTAAWSEIIE